MIALIIGMLVSLIVTLVGTPLLIRLVHKLHYGQYIRQDGPQSHLVKRGTPTLGGVVINFAILLGWASSALYRYLRSGDVPSWSAALVLFAMLSMGLLGFIDDFAKVRKKQNEGLSVGGKFIGQFIFATIYAVLALLIPTKSGFPSAQAGISFIEQPFFNFDFAGRAVAIILFVIWVNFLMTAWTNAVNLTDGLDGLAARASLSSFPAKSVIWIAGGLAKGSRFEDLVKDQAHTIKAAVIIGKDQQPMIEAFASQAPDIPVTIIDPEDNDTVMDRAVEACGTYAAAGDIVLMAPACASMDQFKSYADRGNRFAAAAKTWSEVHGLH